MSRFLPGTSRLEEASAFKKPDAIFEVSYDSRPKRSVRSLNSKVEVKGSHIAASYSGGLVVVVKQVTKS